MTSLLISITALLIAGLSLWRAWVASSAATTSADAAKGSEEIARKALAESKRVANAAEGATETARAALQEERACIITAECVPPASQRPGQTVPALIHGGKGWASNIKYYLTAENHTGNRLELKRSYPSLGGGAIHRLGEAGIWVKVWGHVEWEDSNDQPFFSCREENEERWATRPGRSPVIHGQA